MRRLRLVALCLAIGALIPTAITPGVIGSDFPMIPTAVPAGFIIDRQIRDTRGPIPSVLTYAHKFGEVKPGDPGYVPEPKPGEPGYEPSGDGR